MTNTHRSLRVELTQDDALVQAAQALRYQVFFPDAYAKDPSGTDADAFDALCEHLVVIDEAAENAVVGTYRIRLFTAEHAEQSLYTQTEFDLTKLLAQQKRLLELGRSCVHPGYRDGEVIKLLWQAIGSYITAHKVDYLFGCVSFPEANAAAHHIALSYLHHHHALPPEIAPTPQPHCAAEYEPLQVAQLPDQKTVFSSLPPLVKGYIRIGGKFGTGAVLDAECNTLDVCLLVDPANITPRYMAKFVA